MNRYSFKVGDRALITARGPFYAFVDGWRGRVAGYQSGHVVLIGPGMTDHGQAPEGGAPNITLMVPPDQLALTV